MIRELQRLKGFFEYIYASDHFFVTMFLLQLLALFWTFVIFLKAASWLLHAGVVKASIYTWNNPGGVLPQQ